MLNINLNRRTLRLAVLVSVSLTVVFSVAVSSCNQNSKPKLHYTGNVKTDGEMLVQQYCTGCHKLVPLNALNKDVWQYHILPDMAKYLQVKYYVGGYFKPDSAAGGISLDDWNRIVKYYQTLSPDTLPKVKPPVPLMHDWAGFTLKTPAAVTIAPYTTLAIGNPYNHKIYSSDLETQKLYEWDSQLKPREVATLPSAAVNALFNPNGNAILSSVGLIGIVDFPNGRITQVNLNSSAPSEPQVIATDLPRPVQTVAADVNKDGLIDYVVCGQGGKKGGLYVLKQTANHTFDKQQISDMPGVVQAVTGDFNNDGWTDIMALFGTNNEGLYLFLNNQSGGFTSAAQLLQFPPVYGSTSFQLADMNHDGKPDLIYTCGYNYRDSRILKPYHGLYIFINQGNWKFKQQYFYPINGCTKAIATDFDADGDFDIATTAFFADMKNNPAEEFIYFEQDKALNFKPHAIPISNYGRWFSMDVTDANNDGQPDIVLANYSRGFMFQPNFKPFWSEKYPIIVLENHIKK